MLMLPDEAIVVEFWDEVLTQVSRKNYVFLDAEN
jgi:hypothetical protein